MYFFHIYKNANLKRKLYLHTFNCHRPILNVSYNLEINLLYWAQNTGDEGQDRRLFREEKKVAIIVKKTICFKLA